MQIFIKILLIPDELIFLVIAQVAGEDTSHGVPPRLVSPPTAKCT